MRSCILNSINEDKSLGYSYLCNYDFSKDFQSKKIGKTYTRINEFGEKINSNLYIQCTKLKNISTNDETFKNI